MAQLVKNLPAMQDPGSIPGLGRSAGEGKSYPLQYSGLENSVDCIVHGVAKSWTRLSDFHFLFMKSEILPFVAPWIELEGSMLNEVSRMGKTNNV